jgi:hypothetical protein
MYCTYRTHHKITCASRTSTTKWTTHTTLTTKLLVRPERLRRYVRLEYSLQNFTHESGMSMKKCIAHTVLTTKLLVHPECLRRYGQHILHSLQNYLCICIAYDDMYSTNCNRYNILFMSPETSMKKCMAHTVLTTKLTLCPERL